MKFSKTSKFIQGYSISVVCLLFSPLSCWLHPRASRWPIILQQKFVISSTEISVSTEVSNSFVHCLESVVRILLINLHVAVHLQCSSFFEAFSLFLSFQSWSLQTNKNYFLIMKRENLYIFCLITICCMSLSPEIQNSGSIGGGGGWGEGCLAKDFKDSFFLKHTFSLLSYTVLLFFSLI